MPRTESPTNWEFAQYALQRNDEAIRFSEAKAGLVLTLTGLILGLVSSRVAQLVDVLARQLCWMRVFTLVSMATLLSGIVVVIGASLGIMFPRLHVTDTTSHLNFIYVASISEQQSIDKMSHIESDAALDQTISQVHATAVIASRKFGLMRLATVGIALVLVGSTIMVVLGYLI